MLSSRVVTGFSQLCYINEKIQNTLRHFEKNPSIDTRREAYELGVSTTVVWRSLAGGKCQPAGEGAVDG